MKQRYHLIIIVILIAAAVWVVLPNNTGIHLGSFSHEIKFVQGLDLQGGLHVLLEVDLSEDIEVSDEQINITRDMIENRANGMGVAESLIHVLGSRSILVELPWIGDPAQVVASIKETGIIEFIEFETADFSLLQDSDIIETDFGRTAPTVIVTTEEVAPITPTSTKSEPNRTSTPAPTEAPSEIESTPTGETPADDVEASPTPAKVFHTIMTSAHIQGASSTQDKDGISYIIFQLTEEGTQIFSEYTSAHVNDVLGVVLDKRVISAPRISQAITEGSVIIPTGFTLEEADTLAVQVRSGPLPIPLTIVEEKTISSVLGEDSLQKSAMAGLIGLVIAMVFMALYYRLPGVLADLAFLLFATFTFALFKLIPITLTIPGIGGFVLSIGLAIDANILIIERMKDEIRGGMRLLQAIDLGFSHAWHTIRYSNFSVLIICLILYWSGNTFNINLLKDFSVAMALGVLVNLFTTITVTRTFLHLVLDRINSTEHTYWFGV